MESEPHRLRDKVRLLLKPPDDPVAIESHRQTVLTRTRTAGYIAALVMPVTIFAHFGPPRELLPVRVLLLISLIADVAVALLVLGLRTRSLRRHYHWAFFVLVGIVCCGIEVLMLQLSGGGRASNFLYPYFLILFGIATLFPARFGWAVAAALMIPASYVLSELVVWGAVAPGEATSNLILLVETALIAIAANLLTTRTFFSELEHRRAVEEANAQLRELDKAKTDFFANLSHDLKTPLNLVIGPIQAVQTRAPDLDERSRRYLDMALRGARRLDTMINDLLELARIEAGVMKLNRVRVDLNALLAGFVEATGPYAATVGQTVEFEGPDGECFADVDADKLERVVGNLVSNAMKFSPPGARVTVTLNCTEQVAQLGVSDTGPGIPLEEQAHIFSRFARGKEAVRGRTRGVGVGLAVVREFVELHQGRVSVSSIPGKGATFLVTLPRHAGMDAAELAGERSQEPVREPRKFIPPDVVRSIPKLLLVEDDDEMRLFLATELGRTMEVVNVSDGEAALRLANEQPDIVVMDVGLPGMDGLEATQLLRKHPGTSGVPILVYSARSDLQTRLRAFEAGADDFVHKPVDPLELRARVDSLLRRAGRVPAIKEAGIARPGPAPS